jgi:hypothetical protein
LMVINKRSTNILTKISKRVVLLLVCGANVCGCAMTLSTSCGKGM